jgi:hypothetical protein
MAAFCWLLAFLRRRDLGMTVELRRSSFELWKPSELPLQGFLFAPTRPTQQRQCANLRNGHTARRIPNLLGHSMKLFSLWFRILHRVGPEMLEEVAELGGGQTD